MTLSVSPSTKIDLDESQAEDGDLLRIDLVNRPCIILTALVSGGGHVDFRLMARHMPVAYRRHAHDEVRKFLARSAPSGTDLKRWYESLETSEDLFSVLYRQMTASSSVYDWEVGEKPRFHLTVPFSVSSVLKPEPFTLDSIVKSFEPAASWKGVVEAALLTADAGD